MNQPELIFPTTEPEPDPTESGCHVIGLDEMGTTGLSDFVCFGGSEMWDARYKAASAIISSRYGLPGVQAFYRLCEHLTPADTKETLQRWKRERNFCLNVQEDVKRDTEMANLWAAEIKTAWSERRPCPIIPAPRFKYILDWAIQIAGIPEGSINAPTEPAT